MGFWLQIGSIFLAALSVFNISEKLFSFGLSPILTDLIHFYQAVFYSIASVIFWPIVWLFAIEIPFIAKDILILYLIIGGALFRFTHRAFNEEGRTYNLGRVVN